MLSSVHEEMDGMGWLRIWEGDKAEAEAVEKEAEAGEKEAEGGVSAGEM